MKERAPWKPRPTIEQIEGETNLRDVEAENFRAGVPEWARDRFPFAKPSKPLFLLNPFEREKE